MRTTLRKGNVGQHNFKKPFEFNSFSEIFYGGITRLRNKNSDVFYSISAHKNHFKKREYGTDFVSEIFEIPKIR